MKRHVIGKLVLAAAMVMVLGFGSHAFAYRGMGQGYKGEGAGCPGRGAGPCAGYGANLTDEQVKQIDAERQAFFDSTADLRRAMNQKDLELQSELAKKDPDAARVSEIQKELSAMEGDFDQLRVKHIMNMKKINPNAGGRFMGGGRHHGRGGGYGKGGCRW